MPRSAVRSGLFDQRDRATKRRRSHPTSDDTADGFTQLQAWFDINLEAIDGPEGIERLNWRRVLTRTVFIPLSTAEKLRLLAVRLEPEVTYTESPRGWASLWRLYDAALKIDSDAEFTWESAAISALRCAEHYQRSTAESEKLFEEAERLVWRAQSLAPDCARIWHTLGRVAYLRGGRTEEALRRFDEALRCDAGFSWSQIFRAYCLHDLERWGDAARAYDAVDLTFFVGPISWRIDNLKDNRAWCLYQNGEEAAALKAFSRLLRRYERVPSLLRSTPPIRYLTEVALGPLRAQLYDRFEALTRSAGRSDLLNEVQSRPSA